MAEKNIEDYGIGMMPAEDYRGAVAVLSVLLGAHPFENRGGNKIPWWRKFK